MIGHPFLGIPTRKKKNISHSTPFFASEPNHPNLWTVASRMCPSFHKAFWMSLPKQETIFYLRSESPLKKQKPKTGEASQKIKQKKWQVILQYVVPKKMPKKNVSFVKALTLRRVKPERPRSWGRMTTWSTDPSLLVGKKGQNLKTSFGFALKKKKKTPGKKNTLKKKKKKNSWKKKHLKKKKKKKTPGKKNTLKKKKKKKLLEKKTP